ncbi:MAG TPA: mitochondrial fission ELM1 family protein [Pseudoxanthomonas sp.]|nr:mitochondrial fission ELM1 family protein [Pseudoxanthomonas sp.]
MEQKPPLPRSQAPLWTVTDGHAGNLRQAQALARALDLHPVQDVELQPLAPWRWWAPRRLPGSQQAFGPGFAQRLSAPPELAIGCGRQAALATRLLRQLGTRVVQILDPRLPPHHWDWVVAPAHDRASGDNVIKVQGSLNEIDDHWLAAARAAFPALGALPGPRTAVLLGGPSAHMAFDLAAFDALAAKLDALHVHGSLLITASRRTPLDVRARLRQRYAGRADALVWMDEGDGANPYSGLLAWADRIICTPDSVNMLSEACATRAPVFVFEPERLRGRPRAFLEFLLSRGRVRALTAAVDDGDVEPLRETDRVAAILRERLGL